MRSSVATTIGARPKLYQTCHSILCLRAPFLSRILGSVKSSCRHILPVFGILVIALGADASAQGPQRPRGFVVVHFSPSSSGGSTRACPQPAKNSARTLLSAYRASNGERVNISGHVATRFKASTSEAQINSWIAATGIEVFTSGARMGCRRYVLRVVHAEDDPTATANALRASGLVEYATPDLSAGRPEGIPSDSFFVDELALSKVMTQNGGAVDAAPATYGMGQVLSDYAGPLMRVDGLTMSAQLSGVTSGTSAVEFVKSHGLTTLRLEIPERTSTASVRVTLYALDGTPVRLLVKEALAAGRYLVGWDGLDDRGRRVQPGVYVAVMTAGNFRATHRLVVR